jgi:uncharacterized membrane protein
MSKFGALGRGIAALTALLTKLSYKFLINVAFIFSLGISVYTVADYTRIFLKDKKPSKFLTKKSAIKVFNYFQKIKNSFVYFWAILEHFLSLFLFFLTVDCLFYQRQKEKNNKKNATKTYF